MRSSQEIPKDNDMTQDQPLLCKLEKENREPSPMKNKIVSIYQQKRSYILNWLKKFGQKLKISREAATLTHFFVDQFYERQPYESGQVRINLITILMIASKITDFKILFPKTMSYIFSIEQKTLQEVQKNIFISISHCVLEASYASLINFYLHKWMGRLGIQFFSQSELSYLLFREIHFYGQTIYEEKGNFDSSDVYQILFFVLKTQEFKEETITFVLGEIFEMLPQQKTLSSSILKNGRVKWIQQKEHEIAQQYEKRKEFESYNQFLIRYFK